MNNSTVNFTTPEASTNFITHLIGLMDGLEICVCSISFLFGFPTHSYVLWLIITGTGSGVASEFFNLNLSICEISNSLNCFIGLLQFAFRFTPLSLLSHVSSVFSSLIILAKFLSGLVVTGQPLFQCLMCVERYLAVVHPVTFLKYKPLRYRVICCTVAWIIIFGSGLFCICIFMYEIKQVYKWWFSLQFLLFFSIQLFCLVAVLRALKQSGPGERRRDRERNRLKRRAFYLILITTVSMFILYVPLALSELLSSLTQHNRITWFTALVCSVLAGFVQPVLYLQKTGKLSCFCSSKNLLM